LGAGKEIPREFVVARGDGAEVLEQTEEAFDEVAFTLSTKAHACGALRLTLGGMTG
jgi:hypothetical protein